MIYLLYEQEKARMAHLFFIAPSLHRESLHQHASSYFLRPASRAVPVDIVLLICRIVTSILITCGKGLALESPPLKRECSPGTSRRDKIPRRLHCGLRSDMRNPTQSASRKWSSRRSSIFIYLDKYMLHGVYEVSGICVRNHCGAEPPCDIESPGLVATVGGRDRAPASYAAADRVKAPASAARGRFRGIHGGRTAPSLSAETSTIRGTRCLAGSVPPVLVRSPGCSRTPP